MYSDEHAGGDSKLQRLSDADDWEISEGYPDIRGWDVMDAEGNRIGRVDDLLVDTSAERVRAIEVAREGGAGETRYPITPAHIDERQRRVIVSGTGFDTGAGYEAGAFGKDEEAHIVRREEELDVEKRMHDAGEVSIRKRVETEHVREAVPRTHEEVTVERRPVAGDRSAAPDIREEEIRVPVVEEEVVVEKRPVVKEEVVVRTKPVTDEKIVEADLRKERVDIDRPNLDERDRRPDQR
jgi:uncharacterized protein (TIGR02271 family)